MLREISHADGSKTAGGFHPAGRAACPPLVLGNVDARGGRFRHRAYASAQDVLSWINKLVRKTAVEAVEKSVCQRTSSPSDLC